jgi:hypothetical protein
MGPTLDDTTVVEDDDLVGVFHGTEPVGNNKAGAAGEEFLQRMLDEAFGLWVDRAGGLVKDQDSRLGDHGPGNGNHLSLSATQTPAPFPDFGVIALRES